jgi:hypothetical protein
MELLEPDEPPAQDDNLRHRGCLQKRAHPNHPWQHQVTEDQVVVGEAERDEYLHPHEPTYGHPLNIEVVETRDRATIL